MHTPCSNKTSSLEKENLLLYVYIFKKIMEKSSSYIPTSKVIRSCSYWQILLKTSNAFESSVSNEM